MTALRLVRRRAGDGTVWYAAGIWMSADGRFWVTGGRDGWYIEPRLRHPDWPLVTQLLDRHGLTGTKFELRRDAVAALETALVVNRGA